jgi:hypothetical protein
MKITLWEAETIGIKGRHVRWQVMRSGEVVASGETRQGRPEATRRARAVMEALKALEQGPIATMPIATS